MSADKFPVAISGSGNQLIIAAPTGPGAFVRVLGYNLTAPAAAVVSHSTAGSGGTVVGTDYLGAGNALDRTDNSGLMDLPPNTAYYIQTTATIGGSVRACVIGAG